MSNSGQRQRSGLGEAPTDTGGHSRGLLLAGTAPAAGCPSAPTGAVGTVTLKGIDDTTLLLISLGTSHPLVLSANVAPLRLELTATPSRCETQVLAASKIGTVVPFHLITSHYPSGYLGIVLSNKPKFEYCHCFSLACGYSGSGSATRWSRSAQSERGGPMSVASVDYRECRFHLSPAPQSSVPRYLKCAAPAFTI